MTIMDLPETTRLIQLAEECAECTQAALKLVRSMHNDTPVDETTATDNLIEELADVRVCMNAVADIAPIDLIVDMAFKKTERWEKRINGGM
jgi:NTP pyrophosphatase (non-canonical NTP hydrolase)